MSLTLHASPLQGFTDFRFRNTFRKYFGGIDVFYAPYIRLTGKQEIKGSFARDILLENNSEIELIPQILTNDAEAFLFVARYVQELGYKELNWNLGCPYPMVAKRGLGSGLIKYPEKINNILDKVYSESNIEVSIKMRLGFESSDEILKVFPIFEKYPIKNIALHPRIGKQLYKGGVDLEAFQHAMASTHHKLIYNGDINSVSRFKEMEERFPTIDTWMLGRGMIADPFLPEMIEGNTSLYPENKIERFGKFHDTLFYEYEQALSGPSHVLMKMLHFWGYFITSFPNSRKGLKKIKKARNILAYENAVKEILLNEGL